jgi:hypothetical protein
MVGGLDGETKVTTVTGGAVPKVCFAADLRTVNQSRSPSEHAPGPRGSPQEPHEPVDAGALAEPLADTAKTLSCGLSFLLSHLGHFACRGRRARFQTRADIPDRCIRKSA